MSLAVIHWHRVLGLAALLDAFFIAGYMLGRAS